MRALGAAQPRGTASARRPRWATTVSTRAALDSPRSYSAHEVGQQLSAVIEPCALLETLWVKVDSGHYDWLGVQESRGRRVSPDAR